MAVPGVDGTTNLSNTYTRKEVDPTTNRKNLSETYVRKDVQPNNSSMSMDDFFKLLAAQLQYQDMSNPMSNSEMMNQLTQMSSMSTMSNLTKTMEAMSTTMTDAMESLSQISLSSYATNLLGKEVTVADLDDKGELIGHTIGVVEGVALTGSNPYIYVNGKAYTLTQLMSMGAVPLKSEDGTDKDDSEGNEDGGDKTETETV